MVMRLACYGVYSQRGGELSRLSGSLAFLYQDVDGGLAAEVTSAAPAGRSGLCAAAVAGSGAARVLKYCSTVLLGRLPMLR